jgi:SAM-dependent methyltransferase
VGGSSFQAANVEEETMSVPYRLFYRLGFHPWEDLAEHPPFADKLTELFEREESGREPPYGRALDLGCGSAVWGVKLAERGWQVTGVDLVEKALERARERVREAGVDVRLVQGDVTDLQGTGVGGGPAGPGHGDIPRAQCRPARGDGSRGQRDRR